jgi:hypothetical protein
MSCSNTSNDEGATWWQAALMIRGQTEVEQRNIRSVWIWCFVWGAAFIAATAALESLRHIQGWSAWLVALTPIVLSLPALLANVRFIREADEFMRKVQLQGIAIGFAAGFFFCLGYPMLEQVGAPELPVIFAIVPLGVGWALGSFFIAFRHR